MKNIIVHTGYIPMSILRHAKTLEPKGVPAHLIMLTPEINIANKTNQLLANLFDNETLEIATNNTIAVYTIRAYVAKHSNDYKVEYRNYTADNYRSNDTSHYQRITQDDRGNFENAPDGFFDTIDKLLLQMLEIDDVPHKKRIAIAITDKRILNDVLDDNEKLYFLKELAGYETECVLNEDWLTWTDQTNKIEQINFYKSLKSDHERRIYAIAIGQQYALDFLCQPIEDILRAYDLDCINTFFQNTEFYISEDAK